MDQQSLFRKSSLDRITSPEQLTDYLRVTNPAVWIVLAAIILLLVGMLIWSSIAIIDSYVTGTAQVQDGKMVVTFDDAKFAQSVKAGMTVNVGDSSSVITGVGTTENGSVFASAETALADGSYPARVVYKRTQVISLLFR